MITITENVVIKSRKYLSIQLIQSAAYFAREACKKEKNKVSPNTPDYVQHQSYVVGTIWTASGFLEAHINELFSDVAEQHKEHVGPLGEEVIDLLGRMWKRGIPRTAHYSILEKYEVFLDLARAEKFDRGTSPYQDVHYMITLRNALVHYEPEWMSVGNAAPSQAADMHKLEKQLKGKFMINPLTGAGNPFYPDKCMGHGCAQWCVESSVKFVDEFCGKLGIKPTFDHVRATLGTE